MTQTEVILIAELKRGSKEAFDRIYRLYAGRLLGYCLQYAKCREDAEEMVQDVFVSLWKHRESIRQEETLRSLLFTMCGSIYVESLYSIPGMGGLLVDVIKRQDNTMVQALVLIFAVIGILGLLLGDILMAIVDPRISFTKKEGSR